MGISSHKNLKCNALITTSPLMVENTSECTTSFKGRGQVTRPTAQMDHTTALQNPDKVITGTRQSLQRT